MPFLSIGPTEVQVTRMVERPPILIGDSGRLADGSFFSSVRGEKRSWEVDIYKQSAAGYEALRNAVRLHQFVTLTGDALDQSYSVVCSFRQAPYIRNRAGFLRPMFLVAEEV